MDDWNNVETNSLSWKQITDMGYEINFKMVNDKEKKLTNFGEYIISYFLLLLLPTLKKMKLIFKIFWNSMMMDMI